MYYIEKGLGRGWKPLAVLFALFGGFASFGIGNISQSSEIAGAMNGLFGIDPLVTGILLAVIVGVVIIGGVQAHRPGGLLSGPLYGQLLYPGRNRCYSAADYPGSRRFGIHCHQRLQL